MDVRSAFKPSWISLSLLVVIKIYRERNRDEKEGAGVRHENLRRREGFYRVRSSSSEYAPLIG